MFQPLDVPAGDARITRVSGRLLEVGTDCVGLDGVVHQSLLHDGGAQ